MDKETITQRIKNITGNNYSNWTIGVTDDKDRRKREHNNPANWYTWNPSSEQSARDIEETFKKKGMKGDTGGRGKANYVYIFKK